MNIERLNPDEAKALANQRIKAIDENKAQMMRCLRQADICRAAIAHHAEHLENDETRDSAESLGTDFKKVITNVEEMIEAGVL